MVSRTSQKFPELLVLLVTYMVYDLTIVLQILVETGEMEGELFQHTVDPRYVW